MRHRVRLVGGAECLTSLNSKIALVIISDATQVHGNYGKCGRILNDHVKINARLCRKNRRRGVSNTPDSDDAIPYRLVKLCSDGFQGIFSLFIVGKNDHSRRAHTLLPFFDKNIIAHQDILFKILLEILYFYR